MDEIQNIWILCDKGKIGTLRQCEALGLSLQSHFACHLQRLDVVLPVWCRYLPAFITRWIPLTWLPLPSALASVHGRLWGKRRGKRGDKGGYADGVLIIAAGRQAILLAASLARTYATIVLLNPRCSLKYFTIVIPPMHDQIGSKLPHVIETIGSLHPHHFNDHKASDSVYTIAVVLGGDSKHYTYQKSDFEKMGAYLRERGDPHTEFFIIGSRRTPPFGLAILKDYLKNSRCTMWPDPDANIAHVSDNPYVSYLEAAHEIIVTSDSISMISEACYFGRPVRLWSVPIQNKRFKHFYNTITQHQHATFDLRSDNLICHPLRELDRVLPLVLKYLKAMSI